MAWVVKRLGLRNSPNGITREKPPFVKIPEKTNGIDEEKAGFAKLS